MAVIGEHGTENGPLVGSLIRRRQPNPASRREPIPAAWIATSDKNCAVFRRTWLRPWAATCCWPAT